ncbi:hypothetical protein ACWGDS_41270 [Streptomyces sp. NPDC055059]|jgi:hypothetical protein|uniref:hypothetical protein n=1 Tax=unclassified Streptomyces TaxID=2593676 RepID=UPI00324BC411
MVFTIAQRVAVGAASVTFAAAGLLATAGPASAAAHPANDPTAIVSHHMQLLGTPDDGRSRDAGRDSDHDDRRHWVSDQVEWILHHDRASHPMNNDDSRRRWVSDQIDWTRDHNGPHHRVPEYEGPSYR